MKIGIVGAGSMGRVHAPAWDSLKSIGAEPVGIMANRTDSTVNELATQYGLRVYDRYEDLLADIDVVDLCVPTDLHAAMTIQAANAGKHIICEKPIALSIADGQAMIQACNSAGVRLFIAMVLRFVPQYRVAQQVISSGQVGDVCVIRLTRAAYQPRKATDNWFMDEQRSGGMVVDLMIHDFDYARWIGGNVTRVFAKSVRATRPNAPGDYALVTLRFASGAIGHIEGGWAYPAGIFRTAVDIAGKDGVLEWSSDTADNLHTHLVNAPAQVAADVGLPAESAAETPFVTELRDFYQALVGNQPSTVTAQDGLAALQIALAARESLQTGRSVTINQEI